MNIINSSFEGWRRANPDKDMSEFKFELSKMGVSGAVFDMVKLLDVSKNVIAKYSARQVYDYVNTWAKQYDEELAKMLENKEYALKVFGIERENSKSLEKIYQNGQMLKKISYICMKNLQIMTLIKF